ncbi:Vacuolar protein sorting-associated protein 52 [Tilletia horrida]|uniref:Vacuolar protein sorting-associated protein 52 n=1 Tax=Tilletia horrida TaxID=155126 RepID=A0AAN6GTQ3_9BASI|nr:Vacuolar protein sorting-associated protein 52 [Tilletia horrida]
MSVSQEQRAGQDELHAAFLERAPGFLALHDQVNASTSLLDSLEDFLSTFQRDLKTVSTHISDLQGRSNRIDARLQARAELERPLSEHLATITLKPALVHQIFDTEPDATWPAAIGELESILDATQAALPSQGPLGASSASSTSTSAGGPQQNGSTAADSSSAEADFTKTIKEARTVAEGCRVMAATKIRPALMAPLNSIRSSVTTNLQVLQSSVLLAQHYRPLYAFLARHASRVSIDVQRAYVAAARLYFETGFRRYTRALTTIRNRSIPQEINILMGEEVPTAGFGANAVAFLSRTNKPANEVNPNANDPWLQWDVNRLACAKFNGPTVILAYQADDSNFRAAPELLFRSLSLVLFDNACSEYAFIVRFFDQIPPPVVPSSLGGPASVVSGCSDAGFRSPQSESASTFGLSRVLASSSNVGRRASAPASHGNGSRSRGSISAGPSFRNDASSRPLTAANIDETPGPEDSASVAGDRDDDDLDEDDDEYDEDEADDTVGELGSGFNGSFSLASGRRRRRSVTNVTRLTMKEQRAQQGRGAADELWKQVMEPSLGHWLSFVKVVLNALATTPSLLSLATMLRLTSHLLSASLARGVSTVLHPVLLAFRTEAGPIFRKSLANNVDSVRKLADVSAAAAGVSTSTGATLGAGGGILSGLVRVAAGGGTTPEKVTDDFVRVVSTRYARTYSCLVHLSEEGDDDPIVFSEMFRLRSEVERLVHAQAKRAAKTSATAQHLALGSFYEAVIKELEHGPAGFAHPRLQSELSHWQEMERSRQRGNSSGA